MSSFEAKHEPYSIKKGIGLGAWGGFIGAVALTGILMAIPLALHLPTGLFLYGYGMTITGPNPDAVLVSLAAFSLILINGIVTGIIFGVITSKAKRLHVSSKGKGVGLGLIAGFITYIVVYLPFTLLVFPNWLPKAEANYPQTNISLFGIPDYTFTTTTGSYFISTMTFGLIGYLVYGVIMGGTVTLGYAVYHFAEKRMEEEKEEELKKKQEEKEEEKRKRHAAEAA
jgi:signal transduction histidine kinase